MALDLSFRHPSLELFFPHLSAPSPATAKLARGPCHHPKWSPHTSYAYRRKWGRRKFLARSFLQDLLLELSHTITDEQLLQEKRLLEKNSSLAVPVTTADVTEDERDAGLGDKETGHIGALPSLQVQSLQEQEALAATPAHPEGLYALYASFFAGNLVEQVWHFAWPSAVALLHDSLLPVAVVSFVSKLVIFIGGPWVGAQMDSLPRVFAFNALSIVQLLNWSPQGQSYMH